VGGDAGCGELRADVGGVEYGVARGRRRCRRRCHWWGAEGEEKRRVWETAIGSAVAQAGFVLVEVLKRI
jgi:hypothetical protein